MASASDSFVRADSGSLGSNWVEQVNGLRIVSNTACAVNTGVYQFAYYNPSTTTFGADQESQVTLTNIGSQLGPIVRATGTGGSTNNYFLLCRVSGAGNTLLYKTISGSFTLVADMGSVAWANTDVAKLTVSGTTLKAYRNGSQFGGDQTDSSHSSGQPGVFCLDGANDQLNTWSGDDGGAGNTLVITTPTAKQFYQRDGSDEADISITGTFTGSPTAIEADFNGGGYSTIDGSPAAGAFSGTLSNQSVGRGTLTVRWTNDTSVNDTVANVAIGDVFFAAGDSNAEGRTTNPQTGSADVYYFRQDDAWASGNDPADTGTANGSPWPLLGVLIEADQNVPVAFITTGTGSTDVAGTNNQWATGQSSLVELLAQATASAVGAEGYMGALFHLEPNAIVNGSTLSQATYNAAIDTLAADIVALTGTPKTAVVICGEVTTGSPPDRRAAMDQIRAAVLEAVGNNANVLIGPNLVDQDYSDGVHFTTDAQVQAVADRWWVAIKNGFYGGSLGRGPRISAASLNVAKTDITLTVDRDLATGTTYGGFRVLESGTPVTITTATRTAVRTIVLALSAPVASAAVTTVYFASENDAAGQTVPTSTSITLPDARTITLPMEPFYAQAVTQETSGSSSKLTLLGAGS